MAQRTSVRLFVYGTLMRDQPAHDLLGEVTFVGSFQTEPEFELVQCDGYPALVRGGETSVHGEVFVIDTDRLIILDDYEDVPALYTREEIQLSGGESAIAYLMHPRRATTLPRIDSGRWLDVASRR